MIFFYGSDGKLNVWWSFDVRTKFGRETYDLCSIHTCSDNLYTNLRILLNYLGWGRAILAMVADINVLFGIPGPQKQKKVD